MRRVYMGTHTRKQVRRSVQWPVLRPATAGVAIGASPSPPPHPSSPPLCPPRRGWRGVDQYVKIESDATHPAPLVPLRASTDRCPVRLRVYPRLNRLICHPRVIFFGRCCRSFGDRLRPRSQNRIARNTLWHFASLRRNVAAAVIKGRVRWGAPMRNRRYSRSFEIPSAAGPTASRVSSRLRFLSLSLSPCFYSRVYHSRPPLSQLSVVLCTVCMIRVYLYT